MPVDKAGRAYWNDLWDSTELPRAINPHLGGLRYYPTRRFHQYFADAFSLLPGPRGSLLEIGCAQSAWLPYFAKEFGFSVSGLDYSEPGCERAARVLRNENVTGEIVHADVFAPPGRLLESFDVVVSIGVAEHFSDTAACIRACGSLLKPGGLMITIIPNMNGAVGFVQKLVNRPVYAIHVPLTAAQLRVAHESAELEVVRCEYFLSTNFGVCNLNGLDPDGLAYAIKRSLWLATKVFSRAVWVFEETLFALPASSLLSPQVNCLARKAIAS